VLMARAQVLAQVGRALEVFLAVGAVVVLVSVMFPELLMAVE
jgi:hypothetical protein